MVDVKRLFVFVLLGMFLFSMVGGVVGDGVEGGNVGGVTGDKVAEVTKEIGKGVISFVDVLFGSTGIGNESLSRFFMAVLIAMFVYTAFGTFFKDEHSWIRWVATIAVTVLAIVGIPGAYLEAIRINYRAMGATILSVIPFLIIFWFTIKVDSYFMARITWLFYALYYLALYLSIWWSTKGWFNVYLLAFVAGFIAFFFILKVRSFVFHGEIESVKEKGMQKAEERKHRLAIEMERLKADER